MRLQEDELTERAMKVLGIGPHTEITGIRYAYYRLMFQHHPDRNPDDPLAHEKTSLINEAYGHVMNAGVQPLLLKDDALVSSVLNAPVIEMQGMLSYEEWLKEQFFDMEGKSIWAF
jgi:hypothetical protein